MEEIELDEESDIPVYIEQVKEGRIKKIRKGLDDPEHEGKDNR